MNRTIWMNLVVGGALMLTAGAARAQGPHRGGPGFGGPMELMGFEGGHGKLVKGAPFSASATSETTSTLQDGTVIHRTAQLNLFRDSQGRSRRELTASGFGPLAASGAPKTMVMISDPVAGAHYMLDSTNKVAHKMPMRTPDATSASSDDTGFDQKVEAREASEEAAGLLKKESLGTQVIDGVSAEGTRTTKTIPAGKIGNDRAIQIVSERWYSPDLQIVVKSTHTDPQFGTTTYTVNNLQKAEPAATLFAVPADYTVKTGGPRAHGRRGPGGPGGAPAPPPSDE
jgi:hypothetical protein